MSFLSFLLRFSCPFTPFPLPFRFVFSCCRFPFVSCITFSAFSFGFPALLVGGLSSFFLGATPPPRAACEPASMRMPLACCLLAFLLFIYLFFFSCPLCFRLDVVCFTLSFPCGYHAVFSVSVSWTRLAYDMYLISHRFYFWLRCTICSSYRVIIFCFYLFFLLRLSSTLRVIGDCPVTTDCIVCSDELMREQQRLQQSARTLRISLKIIFARCVHAGAPICNP